jgi:hypothetical protein
MLYLNPSYTYRCRIDISSLWDTQRCFQWLRYIASDGRVIIFTLRVQKHLEGTGHDLIEVYLGFFSGGNEENHEIN